MNDGDVTTTTTTTTSKVKAKASYHSHDFEMSPSFCRQMQETLDAIPCCDEEEDNTDQQQQQQQQQQESSKQEGFWNLFYESHQRSQVYQQRNYIFEEFRNAIEQTLFSSTETEEEMEAKVIEVGCGHGSTMFPFLQQLEEELVSKKQNKAITYIATDYSQAALDILHSHPLAQKYLSPPQNQQQDQQQQQHQEQQQQVSMISRHWDISMELDETKAAAIVNCDLLLCIFTLSALHPKNHVAALQHLANRLREGGVICFRDYGLFDMTMFRHFRRLTTDNNNNNDSNNNDKSDSSLLFQRHDKTLCYYFTKDYLSALALSVGLTVLEIEYATVINTNRKTKQSLHRVFIHAVLQKKTPTIT